MRGLEIETPSEARFKVAGLDRGKRLDAEAQDGARSEAGPVRAQPPKQERREEPHRSRVDRSSRRGERAREKDRGRERIPFAERKRRAVRDVAAYRVVSVRDLVEERFGGSAFAARRGINEMKREGLLAEDTVQLKSGKSFKVLTATGKGCREAREHSPEQGQRYWSGLVKPKELRHDAAVYRAARAEIRELEGNGAKVNRVRLDYEMKSRVARATERARARKGRTAAEKAKTEAARELGLPIDEQGRVCYPDAQIEYTDELGAMGRVNVEVTSGDYRGREIRAKAAAGFAMHANGRHASQKLVSSLDPEGSKRGAGGGRPKDDELLEL